MRKWASKEGFAKNISGRTLLNVVEGEDKESDVEEEIGSGHEEEGEEEKKEEKKEEGVEGSREMIIEHPYKNGTKVMFFSKKIVNNDNLSIFFCRWIACSLLSNSFQGLLGKRKRGKTDG